jgi:hypothetical protein
MAQETAGTIGIPVLKNEVLPYLADYAKRRERAGLYKQKAEQRAAELAAKQSSEVDNYVPPAFEISKGGYWQPAIKKRMEQETALAVDKMKAAKTRAEKAKVSQDLNTIVGELNYGGETETQKQKDNIKALQESGYNLDEDAVARYYGEQAQTNPNLFTTNHINNLKKWAHSQPDKYISPAAIGTKLLKQYEPVSIAIRGKKEGEKFTYNPLFEPEKVKDQLTGANIYRASKANLIKLEEALAGNAGLREAADAFIKPIATRLQAGSPGMSSTEAYTLATEDFINKALPQGRAKEMYDFSEVRARAGGGGGRSSKTPISIETKNPAVRSIDIATYQNNEEKGRQQISVGDPKTDTEYTYSRSYQLNPNVPVYLMQVPTDAGIDTKGVSNYFRGRPDGKYTIKSGFEYTNPIKSTVYFADKDINFYGAKPPQTSYTVKKGTPLDNVTALNLIRQGRAGEVKKELGYEVTAEMYVPLETSRGDVTERQRPSVKIFIPEGNAASIKRHIDMEKQKAKSFDLGSSQETGGDFKYFSE